MSQPELSPGFLKRCGRRRGLAAALAVAADGSVGTLMTVMQAVFRYSASMLRFYKFRQELFPPVPARDIYHKPGKGKGWPEECPPIRTANGFGFDILANFDLEFVYQKRRGWSVRKPLVIESDFGWSPNDQTEALPLTQEYAWFWKKGQKLPHIISDNVYEVIQHQVKVSTFLYLETDPDEILLLTDIPNLQRPFRAISALIETDWYPASYPWHCVLELDPEAGRVVIRRGEPLCRLVPLKRDRYLAKQMNGKQFNRFFERGQAWLQAHGKPHEEGAAEGTLDITRTYVKQQTKSSFEVRE